MSVMLNNVDNFAFIVVVVGRIKLQCPLDKQLKEERTAEPQRATNGDSDGRTGGRRMEGKQTSVRRQSKYVIACG